MPQLTTPEELFVHELQDMYYAEQTLTKVLPKLANESTDRELSTEDYSGFGLLVDSTPDGAMVSRKGEELGETPLAQGELECGWGEPLVLTITKAGYHPWSYEGACRQDAMLHLTATLKKR